MDKAVSRSRAKGDQIMIAHVLYKLSVGGLENGVVNLVNHLPSSRFRHVIISLTEVTDMARRITNKDVTCFALGKRTGMDLPAYIRLWRILKDIRPDIVHTRNLGTLDGQASALLAGVPYRIHGEHGRDLRNLDGSRKRDMWLRRMFNPIIHRYVALSEDIRCWLVRNGIPERKIVQIYNGVDTIKFSPRTVMPERDVLVIGTVGRLQGEKDQLTLIRAFHRCLQWKDTCHDIQLCIIGDGPLRQDVERLIRELDLWDSVTLLGDRDDIPDQLKTFDLFVLPSLTEGISNTILEAMATGLPVIATNVGGNPELVCDGQTGSLVPPADPEAMAQAIIRYLDQPEMRIAHGLAGRKRAVESFSMASMVEAYEELYLETAGY